MTLYYTIFQVSETIASLPPLPTFGNEHVATEIRNMQRFSCLYRMNSQSYSLSLGKTPFLHRITAQESLNYVPSPKLLHPLNTESEEGGGISDIGILHPVTTITISASSKLDEQMIVAQEKGDDAPLGFDSLTQGINRKTKEVFLQGSGSCKGYNEYQPVHRIHKINRGKDNGHIRAEGHLQSWGNTLNHSIKHSPSLSPDNKPEAYDWKKATCPPNENCKHLSDKGKQQLVREKASGVISQTEKINCDHIVNFNKKRDTSIENRERPSSISSVSSHLRLMH